MANVEFEKLIFLSVAVGFLFAILKISERSKDRTHATLFGSVLVIFCAFYLFQFGSLASISVKAMSAEASFVREKKAEVVQDAAEIASMKETLKQELNRVRREVGQVRELAQPPSLVFESKRVEKHGDGFAAIIDLQPSKNAPLGIILIKAEILGESKVKILDLWPRDIIFTSGADSKQISSDGHSATLQFGLMTPSGVRVQLVVSGAAKVRFSGNNNLKPFIVTVE